MSILEQIVKTEAKVQSDIKNAKDKALSMIDDARKSGLEEAVLIKQEVDKQLEELKLDLLNKSNDFDKNLDKELNKQHENLVKTIKDRKENVVLDIYKEVVKL